MSEAYERTVGTEYSTRDYNPETGRWMQKDPIGFAAGDTNLYRYVNNDPMNKIDPEGKAFRNTSDGSIYNRDFTNELARNGHISFKEGVMLNSNALLGDPNGPFSTSTRDEFLKVAASTFVQLILSPTTISGALIDFLGRIPTNRVDAEKECKP